MVRKQNERTLILQYRIIPLSLHPIFHILAPPRPLSTRLGAFSFPETFSHKFFPKFFPIKPRRLFSVFLVRKIMVSWGELFSTFLVRKIMRVEGTCRSANGGVSLFVCSPYSTGLPFCLPFCLPESSFLSPPSWQIFEQSGQNRAKVNIYLLVFVSPRENRRQQ